MHLTIYVEEGCLGCNRARQIGRDLERDQDYVDVEIIDLSEVDALPESVVAVPAYVLDGRLVSLGNPYMSDLVALIEAAMVDGEEVRG